MNDEFLDLFATSNANGDSVGKVVPVRLSVTTDMLDVNCTLLLALGRRFCHDGARLQCFSASFVSYSFQGVCREEKKHGFCCKFCNERLKQ